jgi:hypothetical protein
VARLRNEIMESADGRETGGALYGACEPDGSVLVTDILGPSWWTERSTYQIKMEPDVFLRFEAQLPPGRLWLGDWHTHDEYVARPSDPDKRGWAGFLRAKLGVYVGVIATPDPREEWRWDNPTFTGWVNRREDGISRCERATIERTDWEWH